MYQGQKGIIHLPIILLVILATALLVRTIQITKSIDQTEVQDEPAREFRGFGDLLKDVLIRDSQEEESTQPTSVSTPAPTSVTPTPTPAVYNTSSPYNLDVATGAVKVNIIPQSGILVGDQLVELHANSGYKVLVNKSSDVDTRIARQGSPSVNFSQVPPGPYSVKVRYKDQWTGWYNITVSSTQLTTLSVTVSGDTPTSAPTPTPKPKPICFNPIIYPSSTGTAPYNVTLQPQGSAGSTGGMAGYEWDFTGDGSWDTTASPNAQTYIYQTPGSYNVRMRVLAINGEYSNVCQTTVTVLNP